MTTPKTTAAAIALALLALAATAPTAAAQGRATPDPANSNCEWQGLVCGDTKVILCPGGDAPTELHVAVRDSANSPIVGETVRVAHAGVGCGTCFDSSTGVTDVNGEVVLALEGGLDMWATLDCCVISTHVTCLDVTIPWWGTAASIDTREWISFDLTGDCDVGYWDSRLIDDDNILVPPPCRTDFNCDGAVDTTDIALFAVHYGHWCYGSHTEPRVDIAPPTLTFGLPHGTSSSQTQTISNNGWVDLSWTATTEVPELTVVPPSGLVPPSETTSVEVAVVASADLPAGSHTWEILYETNDVLYPEVGIAVYVTIVPAPIPWLEPDSLVIEVGAGGTECAPLVIGNSGSAMLVWTTSDTCDWLSAAPAAGAEPPGSSSTSLVCADAASLAPGEYECTLGVWTNAPERPWTMVPVFLTVLPPVPDIDVDPSSLGFHIVGAGTAWDEIELHNVGFANLSWTLTESCPWLEATPAARTTRPGGTHTISVGANSAGLATGSYHCDIEIASDDPDEPLVTVPVTLVVQIPDMAYSHVDWINLGCADRAFICPEGDGSAIGISVRDDADSPIPGAQIVPHFSGICAMCLCEPISVMTAPGGTAVLPLLGGVDASPGPPCCLITTTMSVNGQAIPWLATGNPSDSREFLSPDLNADCAVDAIDTAIMSADFGTSACRTDFNCDGDVNLSDVAIMDAHVGHAGGPPVTDVGEDAEIARDASALEQNYPNPFNPVTTIAFTVTEPSAVVLRICDAPGRAVTTLIDERLPAGHYEIVWDGRDEGGERVGSGVYFCRLEIAGRPETRRMVLLK